MRAFVEEEVEADLFFPSVDASPGYPVAAEFGSVMKANGRFNREQQSFLVEMEMERK